MFDPDIIGKKVMAKKTVKTFGYGGWQESEVEFEGTIVGFSSPGPTYERKGLFSSIKKTASFGFAVKDDFGEVFETSKVTFIEDEDKKKDKKKGK